MRPYLTSVNLSWELLTYLGQLAGSNYRIITGIDDAPFSVILMYMSIEFPFVK